MGGSLLRGEPPGGVGTLMSIQRCSGARILAGDPGLPLRAVAADTRALRPGDLFCALRGERVDAHTLLPQAFAAGAAAVLVDRLPGDVWQMEQVPAGCGVLWAPASVLALGRIASAHLAGLHPSPAVVGITGSVGKTGTRSLIQAALGQGVLGAVQSFNTEVSLPLICLRAGPEHRYVVLELAMRGPGQIAYLARIGRPRVGVLTVIGESHLELLGSVEAIAAAKGELLAALPPDGSAVCNADDPWQISLAARGPAPVIWYGFGPKADVTARDLRPGPHGTTFVAQFRRSGVEVPVRVQLLGRHHVRNALAALAVAECLGVDPATAAAGLSAVAPEPGRMCLRPAGRLHVLDDTFNAAPQSMIAALEALGELVGPGRRAAVLGDMLELGAATDDGHLRVGRAAAEAGLRWLVTVGPRAEGIATGAIQGGMAPERIHRAADQACAAALLPRLLTEAPDGLMLLVKASHAIGLHALVEQVLSGAP